MSACIPRLRVWLLLVTAATSCRVFDRPEARTTAGRVFADARWEPCVAAESSVAWPRIECSGATTSQADRSRRARDVRTWFERVRSDSTVPTLHAAGVAELRLGADDSSSIDRAIEYLMRARAGSPHDASILNDLAVAYLERASRDQDLTSLLQALDAIQLAVEQDSTAAAPLFNRALILEHLRLLENAVDAWRAYVAAERDGDWRKEGAEHVRALALAVDTTMWPTSSQVSAFLADSAWQSQTLRRAAQRPQRARDLSFALLGVWGNGVGQHERNAATALALTRAIADSLDAAKRDASVGLAVRAIDWSRNDPWRQRSLAAGHALFGRGLQLFSRAAFGDALTTLDSAARALRDGRSPAARWAASYRGASALGQNHFDDATATFERVIAEATDHEPALVGKAISALGVVEGRRGHFENANKLHERASPYIERAKEPENIGALAYYIAENLDLAGQVSVGRREALRGLQLLSPYRQSSFLANHLFTVAALARAAGLTRAAVVVMDEHLRVARRLGRDDALSYGLCLQAQDLATLGRADLAAAKLRAAEDRIGGLSGSIAARSQANVWVVQARLARERAPIDARRLLTNALEVYRRQHVDLLMPSTLYDEATIARQLGDTADARRRLTEAVDRTEHQRLTFGSAATRAALDETAERVYDALIELELDAEQPDSAFHDLERERNGAWLRPLQLRDVRRQLHDSVAVVEFAVLPKRLVTWVMTRRHSAMHVEMIGRDSVARLVGEFRRELGDADVDARSPRARLFDLLVRPVLPELAGVRTIAIVPDRELSGVAFAALWRGDRRQYLVEQFGILTEQSAAFFLAAESAVRAAHSALRPSVLAIGDPTRDDAGSMGLAPLPGAQREAALVRAAYSRGTMLVAADANRRAVLDQMARQSVIHFAGHTVFNVDQPERSYLALSGAAGTPDALTAGEIATMRLSNLRIVVLSSCTSLSSRPTRAGAFAGLAYSFLHAGAPATVSTLFDIADDRTASLVARFHAYYAHGRRGFDALRRAQIEALRGADGRLRPPAEWAAFIYSGW